MRVLRTLAVICGSALVLLLVPSLVYAATDITISSPQSGGTVVNTSAQITGTAPANTLIKVVITDAVPNQPNIKHQPGGKVDGTATSDKHGQWIFVPTGMVPGTYTVKATYIVENNETIGSSTIPFVIVDSEGNSVTASISLQRRIAIGLTVFAALLFLYIFVVIRRNGGHFVSKEAEKIEQDMEDTHEEVIELQKRLTRDEQEHDREQKN